ncbi:Cupredoxin [Ascoidea rubescens DSM 1968]|uniref:Cupredoxin n=1 Tax=Ascoidea rubescens DSM 1968 TaxID=1344418 RepID=A0A1D2VLN1_9ASCO|nr:Cupredoxin [Ascoidea rubescens DSM 1968]ODV62503.1 Cupredoxin [Ascoidea rubescens DSM 1968]
MSLFSLFLITILSTLANNAQAETHTWYFEVTYVDANPDGRFNRTVVGFNNTWPLPTLEVDKGDRGIKIPPHFHGLFQNGSNQMDGPEMVTQCTIVPGQTMLYNFSVGNQVGAYWYHSHTKGQYGDGIRAAFIIHDSDFPYDYDEETVITVSEWYHDDSATLDRSFLNLYNPIEAEPIPQNLLFNDTRNDSWVFEPGKTYLAHIINIGAFVSQYLYIENHTMTVIAVDGIYVQPSEYYVDSIDDFLDDFYLQPLKEEEIYDDYDFETTVDVVMDNLGDGINYAFFNNITYVKPKVPTLITANFEDKSDLIAFNGSNHGGWPEYPMRRDTIYVRPQSYFVIRFRADNPGVWYFHCHIEWHLSQGLALTIIEAPLEIQKNENQQLTENYASICEAAGISLVGNAASNSEDFLDLSDEDVQPKPLPGGFTARGIVALVFSCVTGVLGIFMISVYGLSDIKNIEEKASSTGEGTNPKGNLS